MQGTGTQLKTSESGARSARDAATIAEAFRITVEDHADAVAIRTKGDAFTITWAKLRDRVDALAGGLAKLGLERGPTIALMLSNPPRVSHRRPRGNDPRGHAVLHLQPLRPQPDPVSDDRRWGADADLRAAVPAEGARGARAAAEPGTRDRRRRRGPGGHARAGR